MTPLWNGNNVNILPLLLCSKTHAATNLDILELPQLRLKGKLDRFLFRKCIDAIEYYEELVVLPLHPSFLPFALLVESHSEVLEWILDKVAR